MAKGGGRDRNRTDVQGFAVLCITTLPPGQRYICDFFYMPIKIEDGQEDSFRTTLKKPFPSSTIYSQAIAQQAAHTQAIQGRKE